MNAEKVVLFDSVEPGHSPEKTLLACGYTILYSKPHMGGLIMSFCGFNSLLNLLL